MRFFFKALLFIKSKQKKKEERMKKERKRERFLNLSPVNTKYQRHLSLSENNYLYTHFRITIIIMESINNNNEDDNLTEYERQRIAHVARNKQYMARLGITDLAMVVHNHNNKKNKNNNEEKKKKRKTVPKLRTEPTRASSRIQKKPAELDGSFIDEYSELEMWKKEAKRKKINTTSDDDDSNKENHVNSTVEALETSREWLENARTILLKRTTCKKKSNGNASSAKTTVNEHWRHEALARWGDCVPEIEAVADWKAFVTSRLGTPPPPSPYMLLQEYYCHDGWQLLIAVVLMSRVSSADVKHRCISGFFEKFPTPTSFHKNATPDSVFEIIRPLGLFPNRMRALVELTTRFLSECGKFEVGLTPDLKIFGIGVFGMDSYIVFCQGDLTHEPDDKNVKAFVNWQRKNKIKVEEE